MVIQASRWENKKHFVNLCGHGIDDPLPFPGTDAHVVGMAILYLALILDAIFGLIIW